MPPELSIHMRGPARKPALTLSLFDNQHGRRRHHWQHMAEPDEGDRRHALALTPTHAIYAANYGSEVRMATPQRSTTYSAADWTPAWFDSTDDDVDVDLAHASGETLILYPDPQGTWLYARSSTDNGQTWSSHEQVAGAFDPPHFKHHAAAIDASTGDAFAFYVLEGDNTVHAVHRDNGNWQTPQAWPHSSDFTEITGIAAQVAGFLWEILITGIDSNGRPGVWGSGYSSSFQSWAGLFPVEVLDDDSTVQFSHPHLARVSGDTVLTYTQHETGDAPHARAMFGFPATGGLNSEDFVQPYPTPSTSPAGAAIAADATDTYLATPDHVWRSTPAPARLLGDRVVRATWSHNPRSTTATIELDDSDGQLFNHTTAPRAGMELHLTPGYASGPNGEQQAGQSRRFQLQRVRRRTTPKGRRIAVLDASGPWETLQQWRSPIAHQFPPGQDDRLTLFRYFAGRAGVPTTGTPTDFDSHSPGFTLAPGESGHTALDRLLTPTDAFARTETGDLELIDPSENSTESYTDGGHPIHAAETLDEAPPVNWLRLQGDDRYADAFNIDDLAAHGPRFTLARDMSATTNALAEQMAGDTMERRRRLAPRVSLTVPLHPGQRLFDMIWAEHPPLGIIGFFRVVGLSHTFQRDPHRATYETTLHLADA